MTFSLCLHTNKHTRRMPCITCFPPLAPLYNSHSHKFMLLPHVIVAFVCISAYLSLSVHSFTLPFSHSFCLSCSLRAFRFEKLGKRRTPLMMMMMMASSCSCSSMIPSAKLPSGTWMENLRRIEKERNRKRKTNTYFCCLVCANVRLYGLVKNSWTLEFIGIRRKCSLARCVRHTFTRNAFEFSESKEKFVAFSCFSSIDSSSSSWSCVSCVRYFNSSLLFFWQRKLTVTE